MSVGQNLGMFLGPPIVGSAIANGIWAAGVIPLIVSMVVGVVASMLLQMRRSKTFAVVASPDLQS